MMMMPPVTAMLAGKSGFRRKASSTRQYQIVATIPPPMPNNHGLSGTSGLLTTINARRLGPMAANSSRAIARNAATMYATGGLYGAAWNIFTRAIWVHEYHAGMHAS